MEISKKVNNHLANFPVISDQSDIVPRPLTNTIGISVKPSLLTKTLANSRSACVEEDIYGCHNRRRW